MSSRSADNEIIVTAALTGPIATKDDHPGLPTTPEEIAHAAAAAGEAGAAIAHVHVRDAQGRPTADLNTARRTLAMIGERSDVLVQLSTGVGLTVAYSERAALVEAKPVMASLNVCSMTFANGEFRNPPDAVRRLAYRMGELCIKPELEIYDTGHVGVALALVDEGLLTPPLQFSLVFGVRGGMPATAETLMHVHRMLPDDAVWQVVAVGREHIPLVSLGISLGANARTGLEDTLMIRRGELAPDNAALVTRVIGIAGAFGRQPVSASTASQSLDLAKAES